MENKGTWDFFLKDKKKLNRYILRRSGVPAVPKMIEIWTTFIKMYSFDELLLGKLHLKQIEEGRLISNRQVNEKVSIVKLNQFNEQLCTVQNK